MKFTLKHVDMPNSSKSVNSSGLKRYKVYGLHGDRLENSRRISNRFGLVQDERNGDIVFNSNVLLGLYEVLEISKSYTFTEHDNIVVVDVISDIEFCMTSPGTLKCLGPVQNVDVVV